MKRMIDGFFGRLAIAAVFLAALASGRNAQAIDSITVGSVTAAAGQVGVVIPISVRDTSGTPLGRDAAAGLKIQGLSWRITYSPASAISSITMSRAGITAGLTPLFESFPGSGNTVSYVGSFDEATNLIPFTLDAASPGDQVAKLTVNISAAATPNTVITLVIDPNPAVTLLSNDAGTTSESTAAGNLALVDGSITIPGPTLSLAPASQNIFMADTGTITATLSAAQGSATVVALSSSNPAVASVPATVTIPSGSTSAPFAVTGVSVGGPVTVTATLPAGLGSASTSAQVTVIPLGLTLTPTPQTLTIGFNGTLTATIPKAQATDTTITLASSNAAIASVPATVVITAGTLTKSFTVTTVASGATVTITGTMPAPLGGATGTAQITVNPVGITLTPASMTISVTKTGTMTVTVNPAVASSTTVTLLSANPAIASVPASVTIASGGTTATFLVTGVTSGGPVNITATLPAGLGGATATSSVIIDAIGLTLTPGGLSFPQGSSGTMTATMNQTLALPTTVTLASANAGIASVPASVTIPAGSLSATFSVVGVSPGGPINITGTMPAALGGTVGVSSVTVTSLVIALAPSSIAISVGGVGTFTLSMNGPAGAPGLTVNLSSSNAGQASVPASVTIPTGASSVNFQVTGVSPSTPTVTITATAPVLPLASTATAIVTVTNASISINPASRTIYLGGLAEFTVFVSTTSPSNLTIPLSNSAPGVVSVPASVTILAGQTTAYFTATAVSLGGSTVTATLPPALGGAAASTNINVVPLDLTITPSGLTIVVGGTGILTARIPEPRTSDTVLSIVSSSPGVVSAPSTATILSGSTYTTFLVTGVAIGGPVPVIATLPASVGGASASSGVTVSKGVLVTLTPTALSIPVGGFGSLTVTIGTVQTENTLITLVSSSPGVASVPSSVTIPQGTSSATFFVNGVSVGGPATITATTPALLGSTTATSNVTVTDAITLTLTPDSQTIDLGANGTLTVTLSSSAPSGGAVVRIDTNDPFVLNAPGTVKVAAGSTTTSFLVTGVAPGGPVTVTATLDQSLGGAKDTAQVSVSSTQIDFVPVMVVPGQARAAGVGGSFFKSSFWMTNPGAGDTKVRLKYIPAAGQPTGGALASKELVIAGRRSIAESDVLSQLFEATSDTNGVIVVEVPPGLPSPTISARTFNDAGIEGTYGQYIPAVQLLAPNSFPSEVWLHGLGGNAESRSNVGVVNMSESTIDATLSVWDESGTKRGNDVKVTVTPWSVVQTNGINGQAGAGDLNVFSVKAVSAGKFFAYASKIDNKTNDPIFMPGSLTPESAQWIDGVASLAGSNGTYFRSELSLTNKSASTANVAVRFTKRGDTASSANASVSLAPSESRLYEDVLAELFNNLSGVAGSLSVTTSSTTPVTAWARTYNDLGSKGTFGQFIPAFAADDLLTSRGALLQGLTENEAFRTNLGLVNVGASSAAATLTLWKTGGSKIGEKTFTVEAGQSVFLYKIIANQFGNSDVADTYIKIVPSVEGSIYAWASSVDNTSTDQTFIWPLVAQ